MAFRIEIATNAAATAWEDITSIVDWQTMRFSGTANRGEIDTGSGFDLTDDAGTRDLPMLRRVRVIEDATTPDTTLWQGRTVGDETARGTRWFGDAKQFDVSLVDVNKDFGGQGFVGSPRPSETDVQRINYLLDTYLQGQNRASTNFDDTPYFSSADPITLAAHTYEGVSAIDWFTHISDATGKQFFLTRDYELFYDAVDSTAYAAGLSITDSSPNLTTSFPPGEPRAFEDGTELFTGVRFKRQNGQVITVVREDLETDHDRWRTGIVDTSVVSEQAATTRANNFLDEFGQVQTTYKCFVELPASKVDLISWGMTVSFRSAACGVLTPETLRVARCSWERIAVDRWRAHLELGYPSKFGRRSILDPNTTPTPFVPSEQEPYEILEFCNTVMIDSGREGSATSSSTWVVGETYYYRITNTAHSATAITDDFLFTGSGTGQVPGAIPDGADEGTIVPTLAGAIGAAASADYSGAPTVNECWKVEIWIGVSEIPQASPDFGQMVTESATGGGTTFTTNYPYVQNSLVVHVGGIAVVPTQSDPTTGAFTLPFDTTGSQVDMTYQAMNGEATGATNDDTPISTIPVIPSDAGGGRWEVAMVPGITNPPEPVTTPDGSDWVYGLVP